MSQWEQGTSARRQWGPIPAFPEIPRTGKGSPWLANQFPRVRERQIVQRHQPLNTTFPNAILQFPIIESLCKFPHFLPAYYLELGQRCSGEREAGKGCPLPQPPEAGGGVAVPASQSTRHGGDPPLQLSCSGTPRPMGEPLQPLNPEYLPGGLAKDMRNGSRGWLDLLLTACLNVSFTAAKERRWHLLPGRLSSGGFLGEKGCQTWDRLVVSQPKTNRLHSCLAFQDQRTL